MDNVHVKKKDKIISAASFPDDDPYQFSCDVYGLDGQGTYENSHLPLDHGMVNNNGIIRSNEGYNPRDLDGIPNADQDDSIKEVEVSQPHTSVSYSPINLESESTSSVYTSEVQDDLDMGSTRM